MLSSAASKRPFWIVSSAARDRASVARASIRPILSTRLSCISDMVLSRIAISFEPLTGMGVSSLPPDMERAISTANRSAGAIEVHRTSMMTRASDTDAVTAMPVCWNEVSTSSCTLRR